jgi:predicted unusual protein kinase regulating ubiquinone biosynthesis (AarF/ABC1/UbiB family)
MSELINTLVRWGILASVADREAFIEKVSAVLEEYRADPVQADKLAKLLAAYLEDAKENLNTKRIIKKFIVEGKVATKNDVDELKKTVKELLNEFQELNKQADV